MVVLKSLQKNKSCINISFIPDSRDEQMESEEKAAEDGITEAILERLSSNAKVCHCNSFRFLIRSDYSGPKNYYHFFENVKEIFLSQI